MKYRFWLFRRNGVFYLQDSVNLKKESLGTGDRQAAERLRGAREESLRQPMLNLALGRTYLSAQDPALMQRTWQMAIEKFCSIGKDSTRTRKERELTRKTYDFLRSKNIIETTADDFFKILEAGTASTQHYLRCLHSLAQGLGWLPWDIIPAKL